jgi:ATP-dependent DNA helicase RecG
LDSVKDISVQYIKGVGPARKKILEKLGVETVEDVLYFFPRRYEDRRNLVGLHELRIGESQTVTGTVIAGGGRRSWYTHKHLTEIVIDDGRGRLTCVWFNQPYINSYFRPGVKVICFGKVEVFKNRLQMISPEYEIIDTDEDESLNLRRIVPIYPLTKGITQRYLRKVIRQCLDKYKDKLIDEIPVAIRNKYRLANINRSIENVHFPETFDMQNESMRRVSFEEFFFFQLSVALRRLSIKQSTGHKHFISDIEVLNYINGFPFDLTNAQKRAIADIRSDMMCNEPMLRLLQGDVGSGKTLVAFFGCYAAAANGHQSAVMAPTEILAKQHYDNLCKMTATKTFACLKPGYLTGNLPSNERAQICRRIRDGEINVIVGTHALLQSDVLFKDLSYVVIDEQHKFGVRQRAVLTEKCGNPDVLVMTATPIPRTLCITLYGDLDLSILDEMPAGRLPVKTRTFVGEQMEEVHLIVEEELKKGHQAYFVYPIIDESDDLDLKAAESAYKELRKKFKKYTVGLVHGKLERDEIEETMDRFKTGAIDILVATTVLEVGVDVPNATTMVIEHADRFGLAQLHQLRGRIGRGEHQSWCLLVAETTTEEGKQRIEALIATNDGFKIAQKDLQIRGPGRFFDRHQHGLNELKVADPTTQMDVLELARAEAQSLLKTDPELIGAQNKNIINVIRQRYPNYLKMVKAG